MRQAHYFFTSITKIAIKININDKWDYLRKLENVSKIQIKILLGTSDLASTEKLATLLLGITLVSFIDEIKYYYEQYDKLREREEIYLSYYRNNVKICISYV